MKISALIATRKAGSCIINALESVRIQTHAACELIVVDYGPADNTEQVVRDFAATAHRPVYFERLADSNVADARNRLVELATGETVAFLDPHDTWMPRHLANAIQHLSADADLAVSDIRFVDRRSSRPLNEVSPPAQLFSNPTRALFTREAIASVSCVAFKRELASRTGGFDSRFRIGASRDFWLRCALAGARFAGTSRATTQCAKGGEHEPGRALLAAEHAVLFFEKHRDLPAVPAALRRRMLAASLVAHGKLLRNVDHARAARCFWRAWSLQPVHVQTLGEFALTEWHSDSNSPFATHSRRSSHAAGNEGAEKEP